MLCSKDVQEAMTRRMSAERTRRAVVTEAEGKKQERSGKRRRKAAKEAEATRRQDKDERSPPA